jgi:hypothetical protein
MFYIGNTYRNCKALVLFSVLALNLTNAQTTFTTGKYHLLLLNNIYHDITGSDTFQVTTDHMLIKLRDGITENERLDFNSRYPITPLQTSILGVTFYNINTGTDFIELIDNIAIDTDVHLYDINHLCSLADVQKPNDGHEYIDNDIQWNHPNLLWPYTRTHLFDAWNLTSGNPDIIVADMDDGL